MPNGALMNPRNKKAAQEQYSSANLLFSGHVSFAASLRTCSDAVALSLEGHLTDKILRVREGPETRLLVFNNLLVVRTGKPIVLIVWVSGRVGSEGEEENLQ
jgi:hypothetical protein